MVEGVCRWIAHQRGYAVEAEKEPFYAGAPMDSMEMKNGALSREGTTGDEFRLVATKVVQLSKIQGSNTARFSCMFAGAFKRG